MVTNENAKCDPYDCDGAQKTFTITIPFHAASDIDVRIKHNTTGDVTKLANGVEFSIDNANVVTVAAYSADYKLYIKRSTPQTQGTDLHEEGPFPANETERALDRLTLEVQEIKEKLSRTVLFNPASDEEDHALPEPENEYFLRWRDGVLVNAKAFGGASYAIQSFIEAFLEAIDEEAARATIGADVDWHEIGESGEPVFQNSWINTAGEVYEKCAFRKDMSGYIHLKGRPYNGSANLAIFTLPVGYRPMKKQSIAATLNTEGAELVINTNGEVIFEI